MASRHEVAERGLNLHVVTKIHVVLSTNRNSRQNGGYAEFNANDTITAF